MEFFKQVHPLLKVHVGPSLWWPVWIQFRTRAWWSFFGIAMLMFALAHWQPWPFMNRGKCWQNKTTFCSTKRSEKFVRSNKTTYSISPGGSPSWESGFFGTFVIPLRERVKKMTYYQGMDYPCSHVHAIMHIPHKYGTHMPWGNGVTVTSGNLALVPSWRGFCQWRSPQPLDEHKYGQVGITASYCIEMINPRWLLHLIHCFAPTAIGTKMKTTKNDQVMQITAIPGTLCPRAYACIGTSPVILVCGLSPAIKDM